MSCKMCKITDSFAGGMCLKCLAKSFGYAVNTENNDDTLCECGHKKKHIGYETLCTNCGLHYGYDIVNDYTADMYNRRGKSGYHRKYHIEKSLAKYNLTYHQRTDFNSFLLKVEKSYNHIDNYKKGMIKLEYIYYKIFQLMKLPDKQKICMKVKSKSTLKKYKNIWKPICNINDWEYIES